MCTWIMLAVQCSILVQRATQPLSEIDEIVAMMLEPSTLLSRMWRLAIAWMVRAP